MDRLTFLRSMLGNTALLTLPPLGLLPKAEQDRLAWTEEAHSIFIYDNYIRGFQHYEGQRLLPMMKELDVLDLVREYDNEHDSNAVAIYWEGQKLGFLPMGENVSLAYMMDHGMLLESHVVYTQPEGRVWEQCFIAVHLLVPANPSFNGYIDHYMDRDDAGYKRRPEYGGSVELPDELLPSDPMGRTLKQQAALHLIGELRFIRFINHLAHDPEWHPALIEQTAKMVESEGYKALHTALAQGGHRLEIMPVTSDRFIITFGLRSGEFGNGGTWEVGFNADLAVTDVKERGTWIS